MKTDSLAIAKDETAHAELAAIAREAAGAAASYLAEVGRGPVEREYKANSHDIVTIHDRACEDRIREVLLERCPEASIVGEEGGTHEGSGPVTFYVDPIDGTSNFATGNPLFGISIGVAVKSSLVGGVVNAPALGREFWSDPSGAYLGDERLGPNPERDFADALVLTGFPGLRDLSDDRDFAERERRALLEKAGAIRNLGSAALELCFVAAGWADATTLTRINPWDIAAGFHLVEKAGGSIRTWTCSPESGADSELPPQECPAYVACASAKRYAELDSLLQSIHDSRSKRSLLHAGGHDE
ncbi:inositol monophosphatase [Dermabacter sp. p3-SID358]|uniref:inositol monophosphatase family protein n=1 Tax=Dermabacter sp. p3-SID358 TaxID=2916114 RepID=UPI0021A393BF|nr:inositol monophosphatase [Dermabacter sp. p3-SID358]MCT1867535.1 inositol monophosphatase [Dermabacter sp. p3-SID358]